MLLKRMNGVMQSGNYIFDSETDPTMLNIAHCDMTLPFFDLSMEKRVGSIPLSMPARFIVEQNSNSSYEGILENGLQHF